MKIFRRNTTTNKLTAFLIKYLEKLRTEETKPFAEINLFVVPQISYIVKSFSVFTKKKGYDVKVDSVAAWVRVTIKNIAEDAIKLEEIVISDEAFQDNIIILSGVFKITMKEQRVTSQKKIPLPYTIAKGEKFQLWIRPEMSVSTEHGRQMASLLDNELDLQQLSSISEELKKKLIENRESVSSPFGMENPEYILHVTRVHFSSDEEAKILPDTWDSSTPEELKMSTIHNFYFKEEAVEFRKQQYNPDHHMNITFVFDKNRIIESKINKGELRRHVF